jgi:hypothetical protein
MALLSLLDQRPDNLQARSPRQSLTASLGSWEALSHMTGSLELVG